MFELGCFVFAGSWSFNHNNPCLRHEVSILVCYTIHLWWKQFVINFIIYLQWNERTTKLIKNMCTIYNFRLNMPNLLLLYCTNNNISSYNHIWKDWWNILLYFKAVPLKRYFFQFQSIVWLNIKASEITKTLQFQTVSTSMLVICTQKNMTVHWYN